MACLEEIVLSLIDDSRRGEGRGKNYDFSNSLLQDLEMPEQVSCFITPNSDVGRGSIFSAFLACLQGDTENSKTLYRMTQYQNCLQKYFTSVVSLIKLEPSLREIRANVVFLEELCEEVYVWSLLCALQRLQDTYDSSLDHVNAETLKKEKQNCLIEWCEFCYRIQELLVSDDQESELPFCSNKLDSLGLLKNGPQLEISDTHGRMSCTMQDSPDSEATVKASENEFLHNLYKLVRGGRVLEAVDYCLKCNEFWRASILEAWLRIASDEVGDGAIENEGWTKACSSIAHDPNYNIYERKIFAILSQDHDLLMQFSENYRDRLWIRYRCRSRPESGSSANSCLDDIFNGTSDNTMLFYMMIVREAYLQPSGKFDVSEITNSLITKLLKFNVLPDMKSHFLRFLVHLTYCAPPRCNSYDLSRVLVMYAIQLQMLDQSKNAVYYLKLIAEDNFDVCFKSFLQSLSSNPRSVSVVRTLNKHMSIGKQLFDYASEALQKEFSEYRVDDDTIVRCFQHVAWLVCDSSLSIYALALINKLVIFLLVNQEASNQLVIDRIESLAMLSTMVNEKNDVSRSTLTQFKYIMNLMSIYKFIPIWNDESSRGDEFFSLVDGIILGIQELLYGNTEWIANDDDTILGFQKRLVLKEIVPLAINLLSELCIYRKQPSAVLEALYFATNPSNSFIELFSMKQRMRLMDCVKSAAYMSDIEGVKD